jgi:hypothetical protein
MFLNLFTDDGCYVSNKDTFKGKSIGKEIDQEREKFEEMYALLTRISIYFTGGYLHLFLFTNNRYLYVKRSLVDADQMMGSMEAIMRTKAINSKVYHERQVLSSGYYFIAII